jgi:hypothetical protein
MILKVVNNKTDEENHFDIKGCEILIGSDFACGIILEGGEAFPQHARFAQVSHHFFLRTEREEDGTIKPFYLDEPDEEGRVINWEGNDRRIDTREFQVGEYTVCATHLAWFS